MMSQFNGFSHFFVFLFYSLFLKLIVTNVACCSQVNCNHYCLYIACYMCEERQLFLYISYGYMAYMDLDAQKKGC